MHRFRRFPKLTVVGQNENHLIAAAVVGVGPSNDSPDFTPAMLQAVEHVDIFRLLADGAYDSEANHLLCRRKLGIRKTLIPINPRGRELKRPGTPYRRQMFSRFSHRAFGQRWQVESLFSRFKRRLGSALRAHTEKGRICEIYFRVLTHNLMILWRRQ